MKKRLLSMLLALAVCFSVAAPMGAGAADRTTGSGSGSAVNPLYEKYFNAEDFALDEAQIQAVENTAKKQWRGASYQQPAEAAELLRDAMVDRKDGIQLSAVTPDFGSLSGDELEEQIQSWIEETLFPMAYSMDIAEGTFDGDYLRWSYTGYGYAYTWSGRYIDIDFEFDYYTTAEQEAELVRQMEPVEENLRAQGYSEENPMELYTAIYDYVTEHVTYDNDGLKRVENATDFADLSADDLLIFTAYAAQTKGTSVCQGYATLYYAYCRDMGLPVRIVTSEPHAWNAVEQNHVWYQVDSTWDAGMKDKGYHYFLRGTKNINTEPSGSHVLEHPFDEAVFLDEYPLSEEDYGTGSVPEVAPEAHKLKHYDAVPHSCTEDGALEHWRCVICLKTFADAEAKQPVSKQELVDPAAHQYETAWSFDRNHHWHQCAICGATTDVAAHDGIPCSVCGADHEQVCPSGLYADLSTTAWYHAATDYVITEKYLVGYNTEPITFCPDRMLTRAEMVQGLYNIEGRPAVQATSVFEDVPEGKWCNAAVSWASENGLVLGYPDGSFRPDRLISREEFVTLMTRYMKLKGADVTTEQEIPDTFTDKDEVSNFAKTSFAWCIQQDLIHGFTDMTLRPKAGTSRAQFAQLLYNMRPSET